MVRFIATRDDGTVLIGLGITKENVERMKNGEPIYVTGDSIHLPFKADVLVTYGETLKDLQEMLSPFITKDTVVHPTCPDH